MSGRAAPDPARSQAVKVLKIISSDHRNGKGSYLCPAMRTFLTASRSHLIRKPDMQRKENARCNPKMEDNEHFHLLSDFASA